MENWLPALAWLICVCSASALNRIYVDNGLLKDTDGRIRFFHGVNQVNKGFDLMHITDRQMDIMNEYGFNVVRLGILWDLVEPKPGVYNQTYLEEMVKLVNRLGQKGIHTVVEMHQDVWSRILCGHGLPDFYGVPYDRPEYKGQGKNSFPEPWGRPAPGNQSSFNTDRRKNCAVAGSQIFGWGSDYITYAVSAAAQRLYDNDEGILDKFGDFWEAVAKLLAGNPNVLGYGIMNEPWLGDVPLDACGFIGKYWNLWYPGVSDRRNLEPTYNAIHKRIRRADDEALIFYEPSSGGNLLGTFPVGFSAGPGGAAYNNRSVLSYHIYCNLAPSPIPIHPKSKFLEWLLEFFWNKFQWEACKDSNLFQYAVRRDDVVRLGGGGFMTEFAWLDKLDDNGIKVIHLAMGKMDEFFHSWAYWPDSDIPLNPKLAHALTRTYARAIAGTPISMKFDPETDQFQLKYTPRNVAGNLTEIFVSTEYHYPHGLRCQVTPADAAVYVHHEDKQAVHVTHLKNVQTTVLITRI